MKSKEILPESERLSIIQWIQNKMDFFRYYQVDPIMKALYAAESEIEQNLDQFTETFKKKDDELRAKVIIIQDMKKELKEFKKLAEQKAFAELARRLKALNIPL